MNDKLEPSEIADILLGAIALVLWIAINIALFALAGS